MRQDPDVKEQIFSKGVSRGRRIEIKAANEALLMTPEEAETHQPEEPEPEPEKEIENPLERE